MPLAVVKPTLPHSTAHPTAVRREARDLQGLISLCRTLSLKTPTHSDARTVLPQEFINKRLLFSSYVMETPCPPTP